MATNETTASNQWMNRPADERYGSINSMLEDALASKNNCHESKPFNLKNLVNKFTYENDDEICIQGNHGKAYFTNFAFRQFLNRLDYPITGILDKEGARLPSDLIVDILNHRLSAIDDVNCIIFGENQSNGDLLIRSITSDQYARVHDADILPYVQKLLNNGWKVPPARPVHDKVPGARPATKDDIISLSQASGVGIQVSEGDMIAPAGLYRGDRDSFVILADNENAFDDGNGGSLMRVVIMQNSEVGARSWSWFEALLQGICGNHILWGIRQSQEVMYKHVGEARDRIFKHLNNITEEIGERTDYTNELQVMSWMRENELGGSKQTVVDNLYKMTMKEICRRDLSDAYNTTEQNRDTDGDPNTWWGMVNGLTRISQNHKNFDGRITLERSVGKIFDRAAELAVV